MRRLLSCVLALALPACSSAVTARGPVRWAWSGAVTPSSAVVKTKVDPQEGAPRLRISGREIAPDVDDVDGVAAFRVDGLTPATRYDYRALWGDSSFLDGQFQTFAEGPMSFRFVFGSCARTGSNHRIFEVMESLEPLFTLHMGDFHYENIGTNDPARFRLAFDEVLASHRQSSLYRSAPIAYMWDDHDYGPDDSDRTNPAKPAALATYDAIVPHYPLEL
ncbi:MAG TPA: hypothetical protein VGC53_20310, partial [Vicinamibacteria bacterium]